MAIEIRPLDVSKGADYMAEVLGQVASVDLDMLHRLRRGSIFGITSSDSSEERSHDFEHGGLIVQRGSDSLITTRIKPVENTARTLARELSRFHDLECHSRSTENHWGSRNTGWETNTD